MKTRLFIFSLATAAGIGFPTAFSLADEPQQSIEHTQPIDNVSANPATALQHDADIADDVTICEQATIEEESVATSELAAESNVQGSETSEDLAIGLSTPDDETVRIVEPLPPAVNTVAENSNAEAFESAQLPSQDGHDENADPTAPVNEEAARNAESTDIAEVDEFAADAELIEGIQWDDEYRPWFEYEEYDLEAANVAPDAVSQEIPATELGPIEATATDEIVEVIEPAVRQVIKDRLADYINTEIVSTVDPVAVDPVAADPVAADPVAADPVAVDPVTTDLVDDLKTAAIDTDEGSNDTLDDNGKEAVERVAAIEKPLEVASEQLNSNPLQAAIQDAIDYAATLAPMIPTLVEDDNVELPPTATDAATSDVEEDRVDTEAQVDRVTSDIVVEDSTADQSVADESFEEASAAENEAVEKVAAEETTPNEESVLEHPLADEVETNSVPTPADEVMDESIEDVQVEVVVPHEADLDEVLYDVYPGDREVPAAEGEESLETSEKSTDEVESPQTERDEPTAEAVAPQEAAKVHNMEFPGWTVNVASDSEIDKLQLLNMLRAAVCQLEAELN